MFGTNSNLKDSRRTTGIGLHLCKKLCDKLGLGIELSSEENVGTEVRLIFSQK